MLVLLHLNTDCGLASVTVTWWHDCSYSFISDLFYVFILIKGFDDNISADENVLEAAADEELISNGIQSAYQRIWAGNSQNMSSAASAMLLKNPRAEKVTKLRKKRSFGNWPDFQSFSSLSQWKQMQKHTQTNSNVHTVHIVQA